MVEERKSVVGRMLDMGFDGSDIQHTMVVFGLDDITIYVPGSDEYRRHLLQLEEQTGLLHAYLDNIESGRAPDPTLRYLSKHDLTDFMVKTGPDPFAPERVRWARRLRKKLDDFIHEADEASRKSLSEFWKKLSDEVGQINRSPLGEYRGTDEANNKDLPKE